MCEMKGFGPFVDTNFCPLNYILSLSYLLYLFLNAADNKIAL